MQKWEYWVSTLANLNDTQLRDWLNQAGQQGWELVNVAPHWLINHANPTDMGRLVMVVMKRPMGN